MAKRFRFNAPSLTDTVVNNIVNAVDQIRTRDHPVPSDDNLMTFAAAVVTQGPFIGDRIPQTTGSSAQSPAAQDTEDEEPSQIDDVDEEDDDEEPEQPDDLKDALGDTLSDHIERLYHVQPLPTPPQVLSVPHEHQLVAAAKLQFLAKSQYRGGILGDPMGLGKTLAAILLIVATPRTSAQGPAVIVTRKSLVPNWVNELRNNLKSTAQLKVLVLSRQISAIELNRYDVILTNYEHVERQFSVKSQFEESFSTPDAFDKLPDRPLSSLFSDYHKDYMRLFRMLILDESQFSKNIQSKTHMALSQIYRSVTVMLSGTFLDNKWSDCLGALTLLRGHPFTDVKTFTKAFASRSKSGKFRDPTPTRMKRIKKLLMGLVVARPASLLNIPGLDFDNVKDYPGEKILIFSELTSVLDIVEVILRQVGIEALRYDGRVGTVQREVTMDAFRDKDRPMLISAGAGGVGLNLPQASIVIQLEIWWNLNVEKQAYKRAHRPGQTKIVKVRRLLAENGSVDAMMLSNQTKKDKLDQAIADGLIRDDRTAPEVPVLRFR
ncbi:MAG: hypothetical protein M1835_007597 [Candelina submexicana]|nr:MAG: hypothetical protein M1835_007597 [Candelina submexicana]